MTQIDLSIHDGPSDLWTVSRVLLWSAQWLREHGQDKDAQNQRLEAELLLAHAIECSRVSLILQLDKPLARSERDQFKLLLKRRVAGEPVAYILGYRDFYRHRFEVSNAVLVPRPDTETVVDEVIENLGLSRNGSFRFLDVGVGSGCIAISIGDAFKNSRVLGIDISQEAIQVAQRNIEGLAVPNVSVACVDMHSFETQDKFHVVTSNPPYIRTAERPSLSISVSHFEPAQALFEPEGSMGDGLYFYRLLVEKSREWLVGGGFLVVECGATQSNDVFLIFEKAGFKNLRLTRDLAGIERVVSGQF